MNILILLRDQIVIVQQIKVSLFAQKLTELQDEKIAATEEKSRIRTENAILQERVHLLEEQLHSNEQRWTEKLNEEKAKNREFIQRTERERQLEAEKEALRHQMLSNQVTQLERERERTSAELNDAKERVHHLQDKLSDSQQEVENINLENRAIKVEFESYRREMTCRLEDNSEFLEELARQTDNLRQNELDKMPKRGSLTDRIIQLEDEVDRLQLENRELRNQCDDLQAQLLHNSVECGRSLLGNGSQPSLAAELNGTFNGGMDEQKLLNIIKEQDIDNQKLRNYINGILIRVVELHPEILEIKEVMNTSTHSNNSNVEKEEFNTSQQL
ncbi:hypothetical protein Mgra_00007689 [Meloidogyne graminicola]|uniref:FIP-RBD domain-containing protein n=1 Tax=Meloidogyne graminicola TaxID=189291 RepID=A0A8S9ZI79_9BILA|nr:hypothetical protein Mgra_00007689 [Meloidogyne graminicola]